MNPGYSIRRHDRGAAEVGEDSQRLASYIKYNSNKSSARGEREECPEFFFLKSNKNLSSGRALFGTGVLFSRIQ